MTVIERVSNTGERWLVCMGVVIGLLPGLVAVVLGAAWSAVVAGWRAGRSS